MKKRGGVVRKVRAYEGHYERWLKDIEGYCLNGLKCVWRGHSVKTMTKYELIAFIGMLDELATERAKGVSCPTKGG